MAGEISRYPVAIVEPEERCKQLPLQIDAPSMKDPPAVHVRHLRTGAIFPFLLKKGEKEEEMKEGRSVQRYELEIYPPPTAKDEPYFEILISDGNKIIPELSLLPPKTGGWDDISIRETPGYLKELDSGRFANQIAGSKAASKAARGGHNPWPDPTNLSTDTFKEIKTPW